MNAKKLLYAGMSLGVNTLSYLSPKAAGRLTFRIFATPPPPRIRPKEAAFLAEAKRMDVDYKGERVAVYQWGGDDRPLVFCAYGWGYNAGRWRHYVPTLLKAGYRVIAYDPPGHGNAGRGTLEFPKNVGIQSALMREHGPVSLVLAHSFGGGCLVESLNQLPLPLRPRRICMMAIFSEVRWIFLTFTITMGLRQKVYESMVDHIEEAYGRPLDEYDVALAAKNLVDIETLIVHDPDDQVTTFRNALRNHSHWKDSYLYAPKGAGHHLGTAGVTRRVLEWLIEGTPPKEAKQQEGNMAPLPAVISREDLAVSGGVSDYYK